MFGSDGDGRDLWLWRMVSSHIVSIVVASAAVFIVVVVTVADMGNLMVLDRPPGSFS